LAMLKPHTLLSFAGHVVRATAVHMDLSFILRIVLELKLRVLSLINLYLTRLKHVN